MGWYDLLTVIEVGYLWCILFTDRFNNTVRAFLINKARTTGRAIGDHRAKPLGHIFSSHCCSHGFGIRCVEYVHHTHSGTALDRSLNRQSIKVRIILSLVLSSTGQERH